MLRIAGDVVALFQLAEATGSREQLDERLQYLNAWGEGASCNVNVEVDIGKVNLERQEADVCIRFFTEGTGRPRLIPEFRANMYGGLNLTRGNDGFNWSVNT